MSDVWFDEYMYQVVVNKKYLPSEQFVKEYESEPILPQTLGINGNLLSHYNFLKTEGAIS